jgi:tocopherol O-methyltransferase
VSRSKPAQDTGAVREHYDRLSGYYHALWGEHLHHGYWDGAATAAEAQVRLIERLAERARIRQGSGVLDVGCGLGGSARWLARRLGCSVLGITLSSVQARMAAQLTQKQRLADRVRFEVMDARELELPGKTFDVVWVVECSEHLPDKARFLCDCFRLLKPGGCLALCAWLAAEDPSPSQAALVERICRGMLCPSLARLREYVGWMREAGFEQIEVEEIGERVRETWDRCAELVERPWVQALLAVTDSATREFVATFPLMREAYAEGAMGYGMFTARAGHPKESPASPDRHDPDWQVI